jgi:hypothetical protein
MVVRWGVSRRFLASHCRLQVIFGACSLSFSRLLARDEGTRSPGVRVLGVFAGVGTPLERDDLFCLRRHPFGGCHTNSDATQEVGSVVKHTRDTRDRFMR